MMNIKQNKGLFALLLLAVLTACTSEDNITTSKQLIEVGGDKLKIVINEEPFDVETTARTRAGGVAQAIPAGTVDLGEGLEAEVSISQGTPAPKTRATVVSDGHYNIYAYDANTNQMLIGPNKKLSGNVVGGVFTPDAGSRLELEAGTYKFVCCTDGVGLDPTYGTGSLGVSINVKKEMIGATAPITLSGDGQQLVFLMHHRESRFRFRLIGYTNQLTDVKAQIGVWTGSYRHTYMKIPTGFQGPSTAIGWYYYAEEQPIQATPARQSTAYPLANEFESDGYSYLSCVDCSLCFNLSGTIYGKTVNIQNKRLDFVHGAAIKDNGSYTINLKLKPTPALYLFQDGTCGALAEKGSRTPIAVVVTEKTATEKGLAMALKSNGTGVTGTDYYEYLIRGSGEDFDDMHGYDYTWTTNYYASPAAFASFGKTVPTFPPGDGFGPTYYAAGHYVPDVTVTGANVGKWFLPSAGQWKKTLMKFGNLVMPSSYTMTYPKGSQIPWSSSELVTAFTNAGATLPFDKPYAVSGTINGNGAPVFLYLSASGMAWGWDMFCNSITGYVLPFVYF